MPLLRTERFDLWRPRGPEDLDGLCRLVADEETRRFLGSIEPTPQSQWERLLRNAGSWSLYGYGAFLVRPRDGDEIIGNCGVFHSWRGIEPSMDDQPEAGWIVRRDHWGQGLAREAMEAILAWFDATHGPRRIVAMIERGNAGSQRVAAGLDFSHYAEKVQEDGSTLEFYQRLRDAG
ncbi:GNAT family N-acetyltransferase [Novosphingobium sp. M1R2S20]|uniref:GNAT family N-acetyltransferase n=1 Tax=Novosphingobium rhizovicinum TaxID=3228928 RepID=A0ABV3R9Y7_9SPHN